MRFLIFSCLIFFYSSVCKAQLDSAFNKTDKEVMDKIRELHHKKIDTIVCFYVDCIGGVRLVIDTGCTPDKIKYLIWCSQKESFIQRFDECNAYQVHLMNSAFLNLLKLNFYKIKKENIKYPAYDKIIKGKTVELKTWIDHSCHNIFEIYIKEKTIRKDIDDFALYTKHVDDKHINKNYNRNQKSILNKLIKLAEADVATYNKALSHN